MRQSNHSLMARPGLARHHRQPAAFHLASCERHPRLPGQPAGLACIDIPYFTMISATGPSTTNVVKPSCKLNVAGEGTSQVDRCLSQVAEAGSPPALVDLLAGSFIALPLPAPLGRLSPVPIKGHFAQRIRRSLCRVKVLVTFGVLANMLPDRLGRVSQRTGDILAGIRPGL